ncbi:MAG: ABC-type multidrug transport system ATPase subunit [Polaribacter sp.]|jgi:ABC-type multidrug transport system ATPase subunit
MKILETENLTKKYRKITALDHLNFEIEEGMVFGLLGPNGSGKTTTLGLLLNVLTPTEGSFKWFGEAPSTASRKKIGAILEIPCFFPYLTAAQNLLVISKVKECDPKSIDRVLERVGLYERRNDPFKTYSLGMKQRLAIGGALLSNPPVLILDEPTNGLDPQGIVEMRELIRDIASSGKTIILASHLLDEVQKLCTDFMVLQKGKKRFQGSVEEALLQHRRLEVSATDVTALETALSEFKGIDGMEREEAVFKLSTADGVTASDLSQFLFDRKVVVNHLVEKEGSLEKEFLTILQEHD